jgi:alkyl hydroperoxide reductase subunit AhpC
VVQADAPILERTKASSTKTKALHSARPLLSILKGAIRFVYVIDLNVSRDPGEVLRVLTGLQESIPS